MEWREPSKIIADLLVDFLNLPDSRIFLYNDGRKLPSDRKPYILISSNGQEVIRNTSEFKQDETEVLRLNYREDIIVSVMGVDYEVKLLINNVLQALPSIRSQQLQEKYGLYIPKSAPVTDASFLDNTDMKTRKDILLRVFYWQETVIDAQSIEVQGVDALFEA